MKIFTVVSGSVTAGGEGSDARMVRAGRAGLAASGADRAGLAAVIEPHRVRPDLLDSIDAVEVREKFVHLHDRDHPFEILLRCGVARSDKVADVLEAPPTSGAVHLAVGLF